MPQLRVCSVCFEEFRVRADDPQADVCAGCALARTGDRLDDDLGVTAWRDGRLLVVDRLESELPESCVGCDGPAEGEPLRRELFWHPPWVYLLLLAGVVGYVVGGLAVRRRVVVYVPLCRRHRRARRAVAGAALGCLAAGVLSLFLGAAWDVSALAVAMLLLLAAAAVLGIVASRMFVVPARIEEDLAWLRGADPRFLSRLPRLPGT